MKTFITILIVSLFYSSYAQEVNFPDPSPKQSIVQDFSTSRIALEYSRPSARGRKMIGNVERFGKLWRTGANAPTTITFEDKVSILGKVVPPGTYVLYTIPDKDEWTVILNRGVENWGSDKYDESMDVCRVLLPARNDQEFRETFTIWISQVEPESCKLNLAWENWMLSIPIEAETRNKLKLQIKENLSSEKPIFWYGAQFYYEYEGDLNKALEIIEKAIVQAEEKGAKPYWYYHYKARILKDLGENERAKEAATISSEMADEHGNRENYLVLNKRLIESLPD